MSQFDASPNRHPCIDSITYLKTLLPSYREATSFLQYEGGKPIYELQAFRINLMLYFLILIRYNMTNCKLADGKHSNYLRLSFADFDIPLKISLNFTPVIIIISRNFRLVGLSVRYHNK